MKNAYIVALAALFLSVTMTAQIEQVTDINKTADSGIGSPYAWNGKLYFEADAGTDSVEINGQTYDVDDALYVYDGDTAYLFANLNTDTLDSSPNGDPKNFIEYDGKLFFNADAGKGNTANPLPYKEFHITDGTTDGTSVYFDANPAYNKQGNPQEAFVFNGKLYAQLNDGSTTQLWSTSGDSTMTKIELSVNTGYASPSKAIVDTDKVWLKATGSNNKGQLFTLNSDDTYTELTANTSQHGYSGKGIIVEGGFLFQFKSDDKDSELWYSDGTVAGTNLLLDIATDSAVSSAPEQFTTYGDLTYFVVTLDNKTQIWASDATAEGTMAVVIPTDSVDTDINNLTVYADQLFFTLTTQADVEELWAFDGAMSSKVATVGDSPNGFIEVDGLLFFIADKKLWYTEGYADVTMMVDSVLEGNAAYSNADDEYAVIGSTLYFTADDTTGHDDIFSIDASAIVKEYLPMMLDGIKSLTLFNDALYFEADDANRTMGDELYMMKDSITLVADLNQDPYASTTNGDPKNFIEYKGQLYFNASAGKGTSTDPLPYKELHITDGTEEGTQLVFDANTAYNKSGNPQKMFVFNNALYMELNDGSSTQLWAYNGDTAVKVANPYKSTYFTPSYPIVDTDKVWLKGTGTSNKAQLFILDNDSLTQLTTNEVKHAYSGKGALLNGGYIFRGVSDANDSELWYSDGTVAGTGLLLDIDTASSAPEEFTVVDNKAYFVVTINDMTQIWSSDATAEGTMVAYNPADTVDTEIENLNSINGTIVFTAVNAEGSALYKLTDTSVELLAQLGDAPQDFYAHDDLLFFTVADSLWYTEGTATSTIAVPAEHFENGTTAMDVDGGQFVTKGKLLYFVAEANGTDIITYVDAANITREPAASVKENKANAATVSLSPMPSSGLINIVSAQSFSSYKVYDLSMKEVASSALEGRQINVSLEKGMYILRLEGANTMVAKTIMIK